MENKMILEYYVALLPFLGKVLGPSVEIVVHDISNPEHSLIAIENPISGRRVGDCLTDLFREMIMAKDVANRDFMDNYDGHSKNASFLSSTYFIRNKGKLIGLLCVNKNIAAAESLNIAIRNVINAYNLTPCTKSDVSETFNETIENVMKSRIHKELMESGANPKRMSVDEKINAIQHLKNSGVLSMKGSVAEVALQLGVSIPTIYRYMKKTDGMIQ